MQNIEMRLLAKPLYLQVRDVLVNRISGGDWRPGSSLPNETLLAQQLGISIGTVRKALDIMESERIVTRRQGRGTFVNDFSQQPLFFSNFTTRGGQPLIGEKRCKSVSHEFASEETAFQLDMVPNDEVIVVKRVRHHDKRCYMTETCSLPLKKFPHLPEKLGDYRVSELAQMNGIIVGGAEESVSTQPANESEAADLGIEPKTAVLVLDRKIFSERGEVLEWRSGRAFLRHERYTVRFV